MLLLVLGDQECCLLVFRIRDPSCIFGCRFRRRNQMLRVDYLFRATGKDISFVESVVVELYLIMRVCDFGWSVFYIFLKVIDRKER